MSKENVKWELVWRGKGEEGDNWSRWYDGVTNDRLGIDGFDSKELAEQYAAKRRSVYSCNEYEVRQIGVTVTASGSLTEKRTVVLPEAKAEPTDYEMARALYGADNRKENIERAL